MDTQQHAWDPALDCRALVEQAADAIVACDPQGLIVLWNPAAQRVFGFRVDEALGASLDLIIAPRHRARHWEGYRQAMARAGTRYAGELLRVPAVHKDGRTLSIALTVSLLRDAQGSVRWVVAIVRDETSRYAEERALQTRLAECQRRSAGGA